MEAINLWFHANNALVEIQQHYAILIVLLSILTSCIASYTAVSLSQRLGKNSLINPTAWLILASIAMGLGIWAMHFIGMTALQLPITIHHNYPLTIASMIPAFIASFLAFYVANQPRTNTRMLLMGGFFMGLGIIAMHYLGMAAMTPTHPVVMQYTLWLVILSVIAAVGISILAIFILHNVAKNPLSSMVSKFITALLLGCATSAAHYIGMASVHFVRTSSEPMNVISHTQDMQFMIIAIIASLTIIFSLLLAASIVDRNLERRFIYFDTLTHLPNRRHFLKKVKGNGIIYAIALIKFPNLLSFHHEFNYELEDELLLLISKKLKDNMPPYTKLYRIDDQSFIFIAKDHQAAIELKQHLEVIQRRLQKPLFLDKHEFKITGTATIALNEHNESYERMFLNVQAAMEHPTTSHKNFHIVNYDHRLHTRNFTTQLVEGLDDALKNNEIFLVYQPKVLAKTNQIIGVEALIRWQHPVYGMLAPTIFLPILEANHKLFYLTDWIIEEVCRMLSQPVTEQFIPQQVAINIPGPYLTSPRLKETLLTMTALYNIPPVQIELEITETSFIREIDKAEDIVTMYRTLGFSVALDDFGTGVSSLAYLKRIPITTLKIDKAFIDDVPTCEKDTLILQSMIQLAESLNVHLIIEGVEMNEQINYLLKNCENPIIQGYYYSKPLPLEALQIWHKQFHEQFVY